MEYKAEFQSTFQEVEIQVQKACTMIKIQPVHPTRKFMFAIDYVLRELLNNAVEHGNKMNKELKVTIKVSLQMEKLTIEVWDQGNGFSLDPIIKMGKETDLTRQRNRGLPSILALGFHIMVIEGGVRITYLFDNNCEEIERLVEEMDISLNNRKLLCTMHTSLVSKNIKEIIMKLKPYLEDKESFDSFAINMKEVGRIDSMGITFLIGVYKTLIAQNKTLTIKRVDEPILNLFKIMKLDEVFEVQNG